MPQWIFSLSQLIVSVKLQSIFQGFTCTEFRSFSSSDSQGSTGFGIAALTFGAFAYIESTETYQSYSVSVFQCVGYGVGCSIQSFSGGSFGNAGFLSNCFD